MTEQKYEWTAAIQNGDEFEPVGVSYADDVSDRAEEAAMDHYYAWCRDAPDKKIVLIRRPLSWWQIMRARTPEPPVEEPTAFGSIVRGKTCGVDPILWQRAHNGFWYSEHGAVCESWSYFQPGVEVLRVGVDGVRPLPVEADPYNDQEWSNAACPEHGTHCSGEKCCCRDKHSADPVAPLVVEFANRAYFYADEWDQGDFAACLTEFASRVLEAGKAA